MKNSILCVGREWWMWRRIHKDFGQDNRGALRIWLRLHLATSLCDGTCYWRGSAVAKLFWFEDELLETHLGYFSLCVLLVLFHAGQKRWTTHWKIWLHFQGWNWKRNIDMDVGSRINEGAAAPPETMQKLWLHERERSYRWLWSDYWLVKKHHMTRLCFEVVTADTGCGCVMWSCCLEQLSGASL